MKLLIYSHFFAPSVGGVETVVMSLANGLSKLSRTNGLREFDITVVTQTPRGEFSETEFSFQVVRKPQGSELRRLVRQADVVHVAGAAILPILLGLLMKKPVVVEHHGFHAICPSGQLLQEPQNSPCPGYFMAGRHRECLRCSSTPQRFASFRAWALTFFRRFLCQRVAVNIMPTAWLGTQLRLLHSETVLHGLPGTPPLVRLAGIQGTPVLIFVGRLVTTKGARLLLDAAHLLKNQHRLFQLIIIGDGPERRVLENHARELALLGEVQFQGRLPQSRINALLQRADVVVVPSLGGEVFGLVVAENMLRGLPVVVSDLGAFVEVLGGRGKVFRNGDAADLALRLAELLDDPRSAQRLGAEARQRALEIFPLGRMIQEHALIYRNLASAKLFDASKEDRTSQIRQ
jgi:glycosyltransferase involved in cell wall biosynthesis